MTALATRLTCWFFDHYWVDGACLRCARPYNRVKWGRRPA